MIRNQCISQTFHLSMNEGEVVTTPLFKFITFCLFGFKEVNKIKKFFLSLLQIYKYSVAMSCFIAGRCEKFVSYIINIIYSIHS